MLIHGERNFGTTKEVLGEGAVDWVVVKAKQDNSDFVYVGSPDVTAPAGTDNLTAGFELDASEETPKLEVSNLNQVYVIGGAASQVVFFIAKV